TVDGDALIYMGAGYPINPPTTPTKGIVFVGAAGTAYGDVTLPRDLTIKSGETLTIPDGASLTVPSGTTLRVETGGAIVNSGTITVKTGGTLDGNEGITGNPIVYTIDIKAIPGVTAPVTGETPVTAITETGQYTGTVAWSPQVTNKFAAGTVYTATITLIPKPDRTLAGVAANSFTVAGAASVSNEENTGVIMAVFPATSGGGTPPPGPTPSPDPDPTPPPSNSTTPTEISVTLSGSKLAAEKQTDGTYLIVAPTGTDITALAITFALPSGATISPANGSAQNFSGGPVTYTITAANGTTKERIVVAVRVESPSPTDKPYFSDVSSVCEVAYVANEDGTISVCLRIPFLAGSDPALIEAMKATITGVTGSGATPSNVSYSYVDASGKVIPIDARSTKSASVPAPYLQISFTTPSLDAVKKGALEKVEYWLKNDATEYVQTYSTPLEFSEIALTDETPKTPVLPDDPDDADDPDDPDDADDPDAPDNPDDPDDAGYPDKPAGGGGCSTGAAGFFGLAGLAMAGLTGAGANRKRG
ncbi:MAG: hypothetical protein LBQ42_12395, partial [Synergistaceae bacterium]|nr:hypothetical protein [Synergistaceae bacterium]